MEHRRWCNLNVNIEYTGVVFALTRKARMNSDQRCAARAKCVALMQAGHPWQEAVAAAGLPLHRSGAYALLKRVKTQGQLALTERRRGQFHTFTPLIRTWIQDTCQADPHIPSHRLQQQIVTQFGITVSISHLNAVRASLDVRYLRPKKTVS
jgi:transposase